MAIIAFSQLDSDVSASLEAIQKGSLAKDFESETLDFKVEDASSRRQTDKVLVDASNCFANHVGGRIVVGVRDAASGTSAFVGTGLDPDEVKRRIFELTEPPLLVEVAAFSFAGVSLLLIRVPQSPDIHADKQGRAPRRVSTDCVPMSPHDQMRLREERRGIDWSVKDSGRAVGEVSEEALRLARRHLLAQSDSRSRLASLGDEDLLRALGVLSPGGTLNNSGDVFFCPPIDGHARIVYQYRNTPGGEVKAVERFDGPLIIGYDLALSAIRARGESTAIALQDGTQLEIEDLPLRAVEEALANAVIHRDFHVGGPVTIDHSPEVLTVASPGPLVSGVTPQNILTHPSKPRNPSLAKLARDLRLAEEVGQGVDRMYREMLISGKNVPAIVSTLEHVVVTFVGGSPNKRVASFVAQHLPPQEREDVDALLTLFHLCKKKATSAEDIAPLMQKHVDAAEAVLRRLATDAVGMLEVARGTARRAHPSYRLRDDALRTLGPAVDYNRRTTDEIDRKIIAHVREYARITNPTVRNILDVDVQKAKSILGDLVKREILVKAGSGERGPGVEYEAGAKFPAAPSSRRRRSK
jgi:ATP-dependent DNA helicase RecG